MAFGLYYRIDPADVGMNLHLDIDPDKLKYQVYNGMVIGFSISYEMEMTSRFSISSVNYSPS